nr:hypothetical protein CFP56_34799 [Quercus suber]
MVSALRGQTDSYCGRGSMRDSWAARLTNTGEPDLFGPEIALNSFQHSVSSLRAVDAMCDCQSLDKGSSTDRMKARTLVTSERSSKRNTSQIETAGQHEPVRKKRMVYPSPITPTADENELERRAILQPLSPNSKRPVVSSLSEHGVLRGRKNLVPLLHDSTADVSMLAGRHVTSVQHDATAPTSSTDTDNISPSEESEHVDYDANAPLARETIELGEFFGYSAAGNDLTQRDRELIRSANEIIELDDNDTVDGATAERPAASNILTGSVNGFVDYMARMNVVAVHRHRPDLSKYGSRGNSRDAPSHFKFVCRFGSCAIETYSAYDRQTHDARCRWNPINIPDDERSRPTQVDALKTAGLLAASVSTNALTTSKQAPRPTRRKKTAVALMADHGTFAAQCPDHKECGHDQIFLNRGSPP